MGFFSLMVTQKYRTVIYCNAVGTDLNWAQHMLIQIRDFNILVDPDVICPSRVGIVIQQVSADGAIGLHT